MAAIINRKEFFHTIALPMTVFYGMGMLLCLSPAVWSRAAGNTSFLHHFLSGAVVLLLQSRAFWLLLIAVVVAWMRARRILIENIKSNIWLWTACLMAYGIAFACGEATTRVSFFGEFLALLLLLSLLRSCLSCRWRTIRLAAATLSALAFVVFLAAFYCCRLQVGDYEYAVGQMETPGQTLIKTHSTRPSSLFMRYVYNTYTVPFAAYGYNQIYMAFDSDDSNLRCIAAKYHKPTMFFLPADVVERVGEGNLSHSKFTEFQGDNLFVRPLDDGENVSRVAFILDGNDLSSLHWWQKLTAYRGDEFVLDDFRWQVVGVGSKRLLVLTMPHNNILLRMKGIEIM